MGKYSPYTAVCRADELKPGRGRLVTVAGTEIALFNVDGAFFATEDTCLHAGGPLHEGTLDGPIVTCPWHAWTFDVTTGRCHLNPTARLTRYAVRVREGIVEVGPAL